MAKPSKKSTKPSETPDITNVTPEQAQKLIAELQAKLAAATSPAATSDDVKSASAALSASKARKIAEAKNARDGINEPVHEVKSLIGATVWVSVTDSRGDKEHKQFEQRGAVQFLTESQIAEIRDNTPYFDRGYLLAPSVVEKNANVIEDYDKYIKGLDSDTINQEIARVEDTGVLLGLYHHIENLRYKVEGTELVKLPIDAKYMMVLHAVMDRVGSLTGVNYSANDSE
jgi:hypothetical protein